MFSFSSEVLWTLKRKTQPVQVIVSFQMSQSLSLSETAPVREMCKHFKVVETHHMLPPISLMCSWCTH